MADINEILGRQINSVKELKAAIKELQDSLVGVDADSEQFKTTSEQLAAAQAELNKVTRAGKDDTDAAADSIRGMEQEYKKLYDTYKMLTEEQRNSDFGKSMAESLENLSTRLNDTKKDVGNFKDNIGRYAQSATEAFNGMGISIGGLQTPMKLAAGGAKTLGAALKSLIANPVGAIIMAIVVAFKALTAIAERVKKAINDNEESSNRLKEAMAVFKPVIDAVSNAFDFLGKIVVKVVEGISKVAEKIMSVIPGMKKAIDSHKELAKATNELTKAQREASVENSKKTAEIERLREEASAVDDVTEKRRLLEEAKALQAEVDQKNIELAQEELRIMEEYAAKTANSAEENEKLAAAQKKVNDAIAQGERNMRMYNKQLSATETKTKSAGGAAVDYRKKAKELYEQLIEDNKDEITKLTEKYEKEKKLLEKYHLDTTLLTKKYNKDISVLYAKQATDRLKTWEDIISAEATSFDKYVELSRIGLTETEREIKSMEDEIKNLETGAWTRLKRIEAMFNNLFTKLEGHPLSDAISLVFDSGDIANITNYDAVVSKLQAKIEERAKNFPKEAEQYKAALDAVTKLGAERWVKITTEIEKTAAELSSFNHIAVETGLDVASELEAIPKKIKIIQKALADAKAQLRIDQVVNDALEASLQNNLDSVLNDSMQKIKENIALNNWEALDSEKKVLEEELVNFQGTYEKKLELLARYYEVVSEMRNADYEAEVLQLERSRGVWDAAFDHFDTWTSSLDSVLGTIGSVMQAEIDSGKLTEKEAKRKEKALKNLEAVQLAVAIANIAANTAAGIMDVWRGYAAELPVNAETAAATGPAAAATKAALDAKSLTAAILRTSSLGIQGSAQIAAAIGGYIAKSTAASSMSSGEGGVSVGATPAMIDSSSYSYVRTIQTQEDVDRLNQPIWCSIVDIENALGQQAVVRDESSF